MQWQLKISQKGFILVAVLLLFELFFLAALTLLLLQAEQDAQRAYRTKEIIVEAEGLLKSFVDAGSYVFLYSATKNKAFSRRFQEAHDQMPAKYKALDQLIATSPSQQESLRRIKLLSKRLMQMLMEAKYSADTGQSAFAFLTSTQARRQVQDLLGLLMGEMHVFTDEERRKGAKAPEEAAKSRRQVQQFLALGVVLNVAIAILLARYFSRDIASRLNIVRDNTERLGLGQELHEEVSGADEIAEVDRAFHSMAQALEEASRKERAIVENAEDVICSIDQDGRFSKINAAATRLWGFDRDELIDHCLDELLEEDNKAAVREFFRKRRAAESAPPQEVRMRTKDNRLLHTLWSAHWSAPDNAFFCVVHDVTDRKEVEQLKQEFMSMVSHDLRAPLTSIVVTLDLLESGAFGQLSERGLKRIALAERNATHLIALVSELLDLERLESGQMQIDRAVVFLDDIFDNAVGAVQSLADERSITLRPEESGLEINADGRRIEQVLINLISNAIKFSPDCSTISLSANRDNGFTRIAVSDQGRGVPEHMREVIFDRFCQVKAEDASLRGGSGLGLAICKAIITAHGGTIGVDSEEDKGSTFWFTIPDPAAPSV